MFMVMYGSGWKITSMVYLDSRVTIYMMTSQHLVLMADILWCRFIIQLVLYMHPFTLHIHPFVLYMYPFAFLCIHLYYTCIHLYHICILLLFNIIGWILDFNRWWSITFCPFCISTALLSTHGFSCGPISDFWNNTS